MATDPTPAPILSHGPADASGRLAATGVRTLRVSVTDRCNLRCRYCAPARPGAPAGSGALCSLETLAAATAWLARLGGVRRIRLTGGEPLVRRGLPHLVEALAAVPGVAEVAMTTNGTALARFAPALRRAGLRRVNVSLDTVDPCRFAQLTGGGDLGAVLEGIAAARAAGLEPVKLNAVLRRSAWREDVPALLDFAAGANLEIRFIELMSIGAAAAWSAGEMVPAGTVLEWLGAVAEVRTVAGGGAAVARPTRIRWRGAELAVGWITPVSRPFCGGCSRLRLDARGRLRRCLMDPEVLAVPPLLELPPERAGQRLASYLEGKRRPWAMSAATPMVAVGG